MKESPQHSIKRVTRLKFRPISGVDGVRSKKNTHNYRIERKTFEANTNEISSWSTMIVNLRNTTDKATKPARAAYRISWVAFRYGGTVLGSLLLLIAGSALHLDAFEAHVLNITAAIENREFVLINKIFYDVDSDHGEEPPNEWVELFNKTETPVDVDGWEICDATDCDTIRMRREIPAGGYAILMGHASTRDYWYIPTGVRRTAMTDGAIGNGLDNDHDMLLLRNTNDVIVDQMNWGNPSSSATSTWTNFNEHVWDPGATDVPNGHMLCRKPTGFDTDAASDFHDCGTPPNVTVNYPFGGEIWQTGDEVSIMWTARMTDVDPNLLKIDLFYITDNDRNGVISNFDRVRQIADDAANTESFLWHVPFGFRGNAWIRIIATGPDNIMQNGEDTSGSVTIRRSTGPSHHAESNEQASIFFIGQHRLNDDEQPIEDYTISSDDEDNGEEKLHVETPTTPTTPSHDSEPQENDATSTDSDPQIETHNESDIASSTDEAHTSNEDITKPERPSHRDNDRSDRANDDAPPQIQPSPSDQSEDTSSTSEGATSPAQTSIDSTDGNNTSTSTSTSE